MSFIKPMNVLYIQQELKEYERLCAEYNYSPAKEEFEDIVRFILLHQGGQTSGAMCESISERDMNYLFENFNEKMELLLEYKGGDGSGNPLTADGSAELDSAVGLAKTVAGKAISTAKTIGAGIVIGAAAAGLYIAFLFKKGKLKGSIAKETSLEMKKLDKFQEVVNLKIELAKLKGEPSPAISSYPSMTPAPEMEAPKRPGQSEEK
jgi:hypothetical protein